MPQKGGLIGGRVDPTFSVASGVYTVDDAAYYENLGEWPDEAEDWVRPAEWLAMPDISGQQRFVGLYPISYDGNFLSLSAAGDYTVDWGDGTTTDHASGTIASKEYNYADIPDTGEATLGYRQVIVSVTPQAGNDLTALDVNQQNTPAGVSAVSLWLEVAVNAPQMTADGSLAIGKGGRRLGVIQKATIYSYPASSYADLFNEAHSLQEVSFGDTSHVTSVRAMFRSCSRLRRAPAFDTSSVTDFGAMFQGCNRLCVVPHYDTQSALLMDRMFENTNSLPTIPQFNTSNVTDMSNMFLNSWINRIPLLETSSVTTMQGMFDGCGALSSVPKLDTSNVTNMSYMFRNCRRLVTVPLLDTGNAQQMQYMFNFCRRLNKLPLLDTKNATNMERMLAGCFALIEVPHFDTSKVQNMVRMFDGCVNLLEVPHFDTSECINMDNMFNSCYSLLSFPAFSAAKCTNMYRLVIFCYSLQYVPSIDVSTVTTSFDQWRFCPNLSRVDLYNIISTINLDGAKLSRLELQRIFGNLGGVAASRTITITNNYGAAAAISKTSCGTTEGSTTITQANTSSLVVGMRVTGTGFDAAGAVTMQDTGDTVTRVAHGIANGTKVSFATIVTTTGILTNTIYYVVNATTDTFQLAETSGGAAIELTGDGSGTLRIPAYITSISENVSVTVSTPAKSTGTATLAFRLLDTFDAIAKGWAVSG